MLSQCPWARILGVALLGPGGGCQLWSRAVVSSEGSLGGAVGFQVPCVVIGRPLSLVPQPDRERAHAGTSLQSEVSWFLPTLFPRIESRVRQLGHTEGRE